MQDTHREDTGCSDQAHGVAAREDRPPGPTLVPRAESPQVLLRQAVGGRVNGGIQDRMAQERRVGAPRLLSRAVHDALRQHDWSGLLPPVCDSGPGYPDDGAE